MCACEIVDDVDVEEFGLNGGRLAKEDSEVRNGSIGNEFDLD